DRVRVMVNLERAIVEGPSRWWLGARRRVQADTASRFLTQKAALNDCTRGIIFPCVFSALRCALKFPVPNDRRYRRGDLKKRSNFGEFRKEDRRARVYLLAFLKEP